MSSDDRPSARTTRWPLTTIFGLSSSNQMVINKRYIDWFDASIDVTLERKRTKIVTKRRFDFHRRQSYRRQRECLRALVWSRVTQRSIRSDAIPLDVRSAFGLASTPLTLTDSRFSCIFIFDWNPNFFWRNHSIVALMSQWYQSMENLRSIWEYFVRYYYLNQWPDIRNDIVFNRIQEFHPNICKWNSLTEYWISVAVMLLMATITIKCGAEMTGTLRHSSRRTCLLRLQRQFNENQFTVLILAKTRSDIWMKNNDRNVKGWEAEVETEGWAHR